MVSISDCYAEEFSATFNANKNLNVYCLFARGEAAIANKPELCFGGKPIDYVSNRSHLGIILKV